MSIHRAQWDHDWRGIIRQYRGHHLGVQISSYLELFSATDIPVPGIYPQVVWPGDDKVALINGSQGDTIDGGEVSPSTALFYKLWVSLEALTHVAHRNLENWALNSIDGVFGLLTQRGTHMNRIMDQILTEAPRYQTQHLYNFVLATWYILGEPAMQPTRYPVTVVKTLIEMTSYVQHAHRSLMPAEPILGVAASSEFPTEWRRQILGCLLNPRRAAESISEESVVTVCKCIREVVMNDDDTSMQRENCAAMMSYLVKCKVPAELSFDDEFLLRTATHCIIKVIVDPAMTASPQLLHACVAALLAFTRRVRIATGVFLFDTAMQAVTDMVQRYHLDMDMVRRGAIAAVCYEGIWTSRRTRQHFQHLDADTLAVWGRIMDMGVVENMLERDNESAEDEPKLCSMTSAPMVWPVRLPEAPEDFIVDMEAVVRQAAYKGRPFNAVTNGNLDMAKFRGLNEL